MTEASTISSEEPSSFSFVLNPLEMEPELRIELIPNHWLQQANSNQVAQIKNKLGPYLEPLFEPPYEFDWAVPSDRHDQATQVRLPEARWRYCVINFTGNGEQIYRLGIATELIKDEIELGFSFTSVALGKGNHTTAFTWNADFLASFFKSHDRTNRRVIKADQKELSDTLRIYGLLEVAEQKRSDIYRAVHQYHHLKALPRHSPMLIIGYFSLIESLIAHKPRMQESLDSINHQIQAKLLLLSKRFERQLEPPEGIKSTSESNLWKRLYKYRSALVHDPVTLVESEFKDFGGRQGIASFLKETVKLLLLFSLKEPEFIADLKNC